LLAGLNADGETTIVERVATRDHTERMLRWYGAEVSETSHANAKGICVSGNTRLTAKDILVPADISSAAFFLIAAVCMKRSDICIRNVGINPTRAGIIEILSRLGAGIRMTGEREENNEPVADLRVSGGSDTAYDPLIKGNLIANVIDELPILAVLATQLERGLEVRDASELRVKETDRIAAVVGNLRRMGADVDEFEDGFRIGRSRLKGARVDSFGDHRIAMAFAIAGLLSVEGDTEIIGADAVDVSFPGFFETLRNVVVYE
jgi:3-phosphoshikimate 1-carboxyvinyltransferase